MKKALVTGIGGQDGHYLSELLCNRGYEVYGVSTGPTEIQGPKEVYTQDLSDYQAICQIMRTLSPDEIYHLAAFHESSEGLHLDDYESFMKSYRINVFSTLNILHAAYTICPKTRMFYASSSHVFGKPTSSPQNELSPQIPTSIYGVSKVAATNLCHFYRASRGLFVSVGILYNHESPRRGERFVSKRIVSTAVRIHNGQATKLVIGDLEAAVDWGYAGDYVDAMNRVLSLSTSEDFVIATGELHTVEEFVEHTFSYLGLRWQEYVTVDRNLLPGRRPTLVGDSSKLRKLTGWRPRTTFAEMVKLLVDSELRAQTK
jgi:GDPmannose 4,6-dehydratase